MKIGVFAGVFDPLHNGHAAVVREALKKPSIDRVAVVAEKVPQHKHGTASYQHRHAMLEIGFANDTCVDVVESPTSEHTISPFFTWFSSRYPDASFSWIVGSDVLPVMEAWPDIEKLPELHVTEILCFTRNGDSTSGIKHVSSTPVIMLDTSPKVAEISSRKIREGKLSLTASTPSRVASYIKAFSLYKDVR